MIIFGLNAQWQFLQDYGSYNYQRLIHRICVRNSLDMPRIESNTKLFGYEEVAEIVPIIFEVMIGNS